MTAANGPASREREGALVRKPTLGEFFEFATSYDHMDSIDRHTQTEFVAADLANTVVGAWLRNNENYREAERRFERSEFFERLDSDAAKAFARARLLIDASCALGEYEMRKTQQGQQESPPSRRERTLAERTLVSELARRFCKSFIEPQPETIEDLVQIVAPDILEGKAVRTICRDVKARRGLGPRTVVASPPPSGERTSGS
jgi:hypothetical protein